MTSAIRSVIFRTAVNNKVADVIRHLYDLPRGSVVTMEDAALVMRASAARVAGWLACAVRAGALVSMPTSTGYSYKLSDEVDVVENRVFLSVGLPMVDAFDDTEFESTPVHAWTCAADCPLPTDLGPISVFHLAGYEGRL